MTGTLIDLLAIRGTGDSGDVQGSETGALQTVARTAAYIFVIGTGGLIGLILGVIAALMLGFIEVC